MRLLVHHETTYTYAKPARRAIETLRLTPRGHNGQFVVSWRVDIDKDCRLQRSIDAFGNTLSTFTLDGPIQSLTITAAGGVETTNTNGVLSGQIERLPSEVFLRETALTAADAPLRDFAGAVRGNAGPDALGLMHALMDAIGPRLIYEADTTGSGTGAAEAFALGRGVCQDFAHVFIAAARHLGVPARYVSGYLFRDDGRNQQEAGHAWAEALVNGLGWVGFDPANAVCPTDAYIRVAVGLDALGASTVRGASFGGGGEAMMVAVTLTDGAIGNGRGQSQRQTQS